ncbi:hypothetical protein L249_4785 [Ophiocordyceps polyrhachis-furcata BCC 54312]|uniref:CFEM domain-containing protein n=1 Tax=Ophiocordyceps polyrhachis-furcata BCC 54312 TaxID=1330021 RepID=A0A367L2Y1_9HYPO|nr:hypothetical protein L249_4785 [Ophiocordyceps polyrhachis-furcata BCC 54312]
MGRLAPLVAIAALAFSQAAAAQNPDTPPCIVSQAALVVRADFAKLGCQNADDAACLCTKDNFSFGVRDCGAHCGSNDDNVRRFLLGSFCAAYARRHLIRHAELANRLHSAAVYSGHIYHTADLVYFGRRGIKPFQTSTSASVTSSPVTDSPPSSTSVDAEMSGSTGGSSQASVIGIGVGVGAAVVALAGVVICLLLRSRKQKPRQSMEISKPLPGSGRAYAGRERGSFEKHGNDIEMTSHRYEDMVPRQQPRTMALQRAGMHPGIFSFLFMAGG